MEKKSRKKHSLSKKWTDQEIMSVFKKLQILSPEPKMFSEIPFQKFSLVKYTDQVVSASN